MRPSAILFAAAILSSGFVRPTTLEAQTLPPTRFPRPIGAEPQRPMPGLPLPVQPPVGAVPVGERPPIDEPATVPNKSERRSARGDDGLGEFFVIGMGLGMLAGIAWGIKETATCDNSCSIVPGSAIIVSMVGGSGYGMIGGLAAYVLTTPLRR